MPGFFSNTLAVLRREIHRVARQPMYWLLTVILPIVAFAFFAVLLYKGVARDIPIAVVDQDNSTLSRKVTQMIDATPTAWVAYGVQGMEEAERLMLQGKIMGIVLIPDFFEKNILNNNQTHLESYLTGTNITVNGLLAKDLQTTVTTFTAGIQLQLLMKQGLTEKQAMAQLMPVRFDKHVLFNPHINYGYYLSPSFMPMMLLIFTIMATIFVIGTELKNGTAREWYDTAGGSVFAAYAGKILPITAIMFLMSELMLLVIFKVVGVPLNGSLTVITISNLLFILSYQSLGAMIVTVLSNLRLSLSLGGGYSVLAFTFSGLTFPIMAMSKNPCNGSAASFRSHSTPISWSIRPCAELRRYIRCPTWASSPCSSFFRCCVCRACAPSARIKNTGGDYSDESIYQTDNLLLAAVPHRRPQRIRLDLHGCRRDSRAGARPADLFHALFAGLRDAGTS